MFPIQDFAKSFEQPKLARRDQDTGRSYRRQVALHFNDDCCGLHSAPDSIRSGWCRIAHAQRPRRRPPRGEQENEVDPFNWYAAFSTFHFGNSYIDLSPLSELPVGNLIR